MKTKLVRGFTLIELMIVVAVVSILAAVAYPSYTDYVRRGHRASAQAFMMDVAQRQQQHFAQRRQFAASLADLGLSAPADVAKHYDVTVDAADGPPPTFTLTATPRAGTIQAADPTLSLASSGAKSPTGYW